MYDYEDFLKRYAIKHNISEKEAAEHKMVKYVEKLAAQKSNTEIGKEVEKP